jgi:hypothetical protein
MTNDPTLETYQWFKNASCHKNKTVSSKTEASSLTRVPDPTKLVHPKIASADLTRVKKQTLQEQWRVHISLKASPLTALVWLMDLAFDMTQII